MNQGSLSAGWGEAATPARHSWDTHPGAEHGAREKPHSRSRASLEAEPSQTVPQREANQTKNTPGRGQGRVSGAIFPAALTFRRQQKEKRLRSCPPTRSSSSAKFSTGLEPPQRVTPQLPASGPSVPQHPLAGAGRASSPPSPPPSRRSERLSIKPQHLPGEIGPVPSAVRHSCFPRVSESPRNLCGHQGQGAVRRAGICAARRLCSPRREGGRDSLQGYFPVHLYPARNLFTTALHHMVPYLP